MTATGWPRGLARYAEFDVVEQSKIAYLLERLAQGVAAHNRENPSHHTWGIGMAYFDIERLGLDEGEEILPGVVLQADGGVSGAFRVLCDGDHDAGLGREAEELVDAVAEHEVVPATQEPAVPMPVKPRL